MKLCKSIALVCTLALASSIPVHAEDTGFNDAAETTTLYNTTTNSTTTLYNTTTNSTTTPPNATNTPSNDVTAVPGPGVPAPTNNAAMATWQATVATFVAAAVAVALV